MPALGILGSAGKPVLSRPLPDLAALARDPQLAVQLRPEEQLHLLRQASALVVLLATYLPLEPSDAPAAAKVEIETAVWLNTAQVEAQYGLTLGFLSEHRGELAQLGAVAKIGHRTFLYRATKLRAFIQSRLIDPSGSRC